MTTIATRPAMIGRILDRIARAVERSMVEGAGKGGVPPAVLTTSRLPTRVATLGEPFGGSTGLVDVVVVGHAHDLAVLPHAEAA
jgi:hypothetical protein